MGDTEESRPFKIASSEQSTVKKTVTELLINWKSALALVMAKSEAENEAERAWARLTTYLRNIRPETNWITIHETQQSLTPETIHSLKIWLEALTNSPEWPNPEQVIIVRGHHATNPWKILFDKNISQVPYASPPATFSITPYRDRYSTGWNVMTVNTYNVKKVGEA